MEHMGYGTSISMDDHQKWGYPLFSDPHHHSNSNTVQNSLPAGLAKNLRPKKERPSPLPDSFFSKEVGGCLRMGWIQKNGAEMC